MLQQMYRGLDGPLKRGGGDGLEPAESDYKSVTY